MYHNSPSAHCVTHCGATALSQMATFRTLYTLSASSSLQHEVSIQTACIVILHVVHWAHTHTANTCTSSLFSPSLVFFILFFFFSSGSWSFFNFSECFYFENVKVVLQSHFNVSEENLTTGLFCQLNQSKMSCHVGFLNKLFGLWCITIVAFWHFLVGKWENGGIVWVFFW